MKARVVPTLVCLLLGACSRPGGKAAAAPSPSPTAEDPARPLPSPVPTVVARINGQPIYLAQIVPIAMAALERVPLTERDGKRPRILRQALGQYIERELLFQEAVARGIEADARAVGWAYDQARRGHQDEKGWEDFLAGRGMDARSFRTELRVQKTVDALLDEQVRRFEVPEAWSRSAYDADPAAFAEPGDKAPPPFEKVRGRVEEALRAQRRGAILGDLLTRLRAHAQIETFL